MSGDSPTLLIADLVTKGDENVLRYPPEFLNSLSPGSLSGHMITLKEGFIFMLLRNKHKQGIHSNETRFIIQNMKACLHRLSVACRGLWKDVSPPKNPLSNWQRRLPGFVFS